MRKSKLNETQIRRLPIGRHCVDSDLRLYIHITPSSKSWTLRTTTSWKKVGNAETVSLVMMKAKLSAEQFGLSTFETAALGYIELKSGSWRSPKSHAQWTQSLSVYVFPVIGKLRCDEVKHSHVLKICSPLWQTKPETCRRIIQRISAILSYEHRRNHLAYIDPTGDIALTLGKQKSQVKHHAAPSLAELQTALQRFNGDHPSHRAFRFIVFTLARTGEALGATHGELDGTTWTIPPGRMKNGKRHRVPLSPPAMDCIVGDQGFLFSARRKQPLSNMALLTMLKKAGYGWTVHGIRSTFRDWCASTQVDYFLAENSLSHYPQQKAVAAYFRDDLLDGRRQLLEKWAHFLLSNTESR